MAFQLAQFNTLGVAIHGTPNTSFMENQVLQLVRAPQSKLVKANIW